MDWQDRLLSAGSKAISDALASSLTTLTGPIVGVPVSDSNPTAAQVAQGQRAQPQAPQTITQRPGTEGTKNGLVKFFADTGSNSGVMIAVGAVVLAVVAAIFMRKR